MSVLVISGTKFGGVDFGTAPGTDPGYLIGFTPLCEVLRVDSAEFSAALVGLKYYHHPADDQRGKDRPADEFFSLTMLVSNGSWHQKVWSELSGQAVEVVLQQPGDFIAWTPGLKHSWYPEKASTMLTVRWKRGIAGRENGA